MKILILSDLHLGIKHDISNNFTLNEHLFNTYLLHAVNTYDYIVLNGDVFELWEDMIQTRGLTFGTKIINRVNAILESWMFGNIIRDNQKVVILSGNHDLYIKKYKVIPTKEINDKLMIIHNGYNVLIAHGHLGDILCDDNSCCAFITCCCSQAASTLEDLLNMSFEDEINKVVACLETDESKITDYALKLLKSSNLHAVILGHTHKQKIVISNNKVYVNDGGIVGKINNIDACIITIEKNTMTIDNVSIELSMPNKLNNINRVMFIDGNLVTR